MRRVLVGSLVALFGAVVEAQFSRIVPTATDLAPTIFISGPTTARTFDTIASTITLSGRAADDRALVSVAWSNAATSGSGTATGLQVWSATGVALNLGANVITVTATDSNSATKTDQITITRSASDTESPTATIQNPAGSTDTVDVASYGLSGVSSDNVAVTSNTWACATCTPTSGTATGTSSWTITGISLGVGGNTIVVTPHDAAGNPGVPDTVVVTRNTPSDSTPPTISFNAPTSGATYPTSSGTLDIGGIAADTGGSGLASVSWINDRGGSGTAAGLGTWSQSSVVLFAGANVLTATARDVAGNQASDTLTVTYTVTLSIDQTSIGNQTSGQSGTRQLTATGGSGSNVWTNNGAGTTLNDADGDCAHTAISSGGLISWTASVAAAQCSFSVKVTDSALNSDTNALSITFVMGGSETSHQHFDTLCALPEKLYCYSLRVNDATLAEYGNSSGYWHYYTGVGADVDTYADPQDAAKMTWPESVSSLSTGKQLRFPINRSSGSILVGWDEWIGPEWRLDRCGGQLQPSGGTWAWKAFQLAFSTSGNGSGSITTEFRHKWRPETVDGQPFPCDYVTSSDVRSYVTNANDGIINGVTDNTPFQPTGQLAEPPESWLQAHSRWTRHIAEVKLSRPASEFTSYNTASGGTVPASPSPGLYHMVSYWTCDEVRACTRIGYKFPQNRQQTGEAKGQAVFSGTAGTVVPAGTVVTAADGITYVSLVNCAISATVVTGNGNCRSDGGNTARIQVESTTREEAASIAEGATLTVQSPPVGINATATVYGIGGWGSDLRDGLAKLWFEFNTSDKHNQASGQVTFTGTSQNNPNTFDVPGNTQIQKADGTRYATDNGVDIVGGVATVTATATASYQGPVGNTAVSTAFTLVSAVAGINSNATASTAFTGGSYVNAGDMVSYFRNVWVLANYTLPATPEDDTTIFKKPVR